MVNAYAHDNLWVPLFVATRLPFVLPMVVSLPPLTLNTLSTRSLYVYQFRYSIGGIANCSLIERSPIMNKQRLLELAGMEPEMKKHLSKEEPLFHSAVAELRKVMDFLRSQESFESKRGKEGEYTEMESDIQDLIKTMEKHLAEY
jgi:hypothetical protein